MGTVCLHCGDKGFTNAYVYCVKCLDAVVHRYCLDVIPETFDEIVRWVCDDCEIILSQTKKFKIQENVEGFYGVGAKKNDNTQKDEDICTNLDSVELNESAGGCETVKNRKRSFKVASDSTLPIKVKENKGSDSDANPGHAERLIISCNGSSKSSKKKKTVESSEAKGLSLETKTEMSSEERKLEEREERTSATTCPTSNFPKDSSISSAEPVVVPLWRGNFNILNKKEDILDGLVAHMSSKACQKVYDTASQFEPMLHLEMFPKLEIWPKSFQTAEPSGDNIALYFFPSKTSEGPFDGLVDEMMNKELGLKARLYNAELLIFTSTELPLLYWRFKGKYYLWGVFRGKQSPPSQSHSSTVELEGKTVIKTDLPKDDGFEEGKIPVSKKRGGDGSPLSSLSNPPSYGSSTL